MMKDTIKYKGRVRKVHKGSRCGRYIISSGRKVCKIDGLTSHALVIVFNKSP